MADILEDGRVFIDQGPVSMVVSVVRNGENDPHMALRAESVVLQRLGELAAELKFLKRQRKQTLQPLLSPTSVRMTEAVKNTGDPTLTPMAAVAGTIADMVADALFLEGVDKVIVNNGGDIALRMAPEESITIGIMERLDGVGGMRAVQIDAQDGIGGICTSGLGGRSHTRGIADSVTVFGRACSQADACATLIANSSFVDCPQVAVKRAGDIDPSSDIADLTVVTNVAPLPDQVIRKGLSQMQDMIREQIERGNIAGAIGNIQGVFTEQLWKGEVYEDRIYRCRSNGQAHGRKSAAGRV